MKTIRLILVLLLASHLAGCALGAKPWERDLLAKREMQINGYPIENSIDDHIYFSREASNGGRGFAGGGCGCN